jgi:hypothetical protein
MSGVLLIAAVLSCSKDSTENQAVFGPNGQTMIIETANNGGNITCDEVATGVGCTFEYTSGKIDYNGGTGGTINDIITWTTDGTYVSWESTVPVKLAVIVKGGNGANVYFSGCEEDCVSSGTGLTAPVNASGKPAGLSNITFCYSLCEPEQTCETAFAKKTYADKAFCFLGYGFDRWGWTNGTISEKDEEGHTGLSMYYLYAGAAQCDETKGTHVGWVYLDYSDGAVKATFTTFGGFKMDEIQFYLGAEMFPLDSQSDPTVAPGLYPYKYEDLGGLTTYEVTINEMSGPLYFIGHVVVCGPFAAE